MWTRFIAVYWRRLASLFRDDRAQVTVEYLFLIATAVSFFVLFAKAFEPILTRVRSSLQDSIERRMFAPGSFHRNPFGR